MLTVYTAPQVHERLDWQTLDAALTAAFAVGAVVPVRHAHALSAADTLLLMPAWNDDVVGVKVVTVLPGAAAHGAETVGATYVLVRRATGALLGVFDGDALTVRRTAAVSAIAARHMAREDSRTMLMVGTGHLAPWMIRAHYAFRPSLKRVLVWGRNTERRAALVSMLRDEGLPAKDVSDLRDAMERADIVCCATTAREPILRGEWVRPGTHLDLVGGFTREMREVDDAAISRSRIVVDSYRGALTEAGDLTDPLERGVINRSQIAAELAELVRGAVVGRQADKEVTCFKSVGTALADLAAAQAVMTEPPAS